MSLKRQLINVLHIYNKKRQSEIFFIEKVRNPDGSFSKNVIKEVDPKYTYYLNKPEFRLKEDSVPLNFVEISKVDKFTTNYDKMYPEISVQLNIERRYNEIRENADPTNRSRHSKEFISKNPNVHLIDMNLVDYKIREYQERYFHELDVIPLRKAFMDIEVDITNYNEFPHPEIAPCNINLISYLDNVENVMYGLVLFDETNPSQLEFLDEVCNDESCLTNIKNEFFPDVEELRLEVFFNEVELIKFVFDKINKDSPDFVTGWNFYFDLKTIETRLDKILPAYNKENGTKLTKESIMCSKEITPYISIVDDTFNTEINKKRAKLSISSKSQFVDMQYCYATIRTGMGKKDSWSLDAISFEELELNKIELDGTIQTAVRKNFKTFFIYSATDSYLLHKLDSKTKDIDLLYNMSLVTLTQFPKVMTKTTSLRNLAAKTLFNEGYILSNNRTRFINYEKEKFRGAFVASPHNMDRVGISLGDVLSNLIFENVVDEDLSSMYPSIILSCGIDTSTMIGKITSTDDPEFNSKVYAWLVEDDFSIFMNKALGLPDIEEVIENLDLFLEEF